MTIAASRILTEVATKAEGLTPPARAALWTALLTDLSTRLVSVTFGDFAILALACTYTRMVYRLRIKEVNNWFLACASGLSGARRLKWQIIRTVTKTKSAPFSLLGLIWLGVWREMTRWSDCRAANRSAVVCSFMIGR